MTGPTPRYVPPHLRGKVYDFQDEPGGGVSFYHPEASMGLEPDKSRVHLTPEQYDQTFDKRHRNMNFEESMEGQYGLRAPKTGPRMLNEGIANAIRGAFDWGTSSQGKAVGAGGLLGALGGGVGGLIWNRKSGRGGIGRALLMALLGGGAGAGITALAQNKHNRREAYLSKSGSTEVASAIILALQNDATLSMGDRSRILRVLARADDRSRDELYRLMRTSIGAGAGMLAMRFLGAKGLLPMLAGGIIGGVLGRPGNRRLERNGLGQISMSNYL